VTRQRVKRSERDPAGTAGEAIADIAGEILRSFELLKALAALGAAQHGLTMSLRAILQDLCEKGPRTVPQIAAGRTMTRQSIQASVDQLRRMGLAEVRSNPAHRRSPIIGPTEAGERAWQALRQRETAALASLAGPLSGCPLDAARETLHRLREALEDRLAQRRHEVDA